MRQPEGARARDRIAHDAETLFPPAQGLFARRAERAREALLDRLAGVLALALAPGERVRWIARGTRYAFLEHYLTGYVAAASVNRTAIVVTDRRVLLLQTDGRGAPRDLKSQVSLQDVAGCGGGFLGPWAIRLSDGRKLAFTGVASRDRKALEALLPRGGGAVKKSPSPTSVQHLCPACVQPVPGGVGTPSCPNLACGIPFRDPRRAARLSGWLPGLGDLYLRHHLFGALELLGSMAMLGLAVAVAAPALLLGDTPAPLLAVALLLVAVPRALDYALTLHMARKGIVPLAERRAVGEARRLPAFPAWAPLLFVAGAGIAVAFAGPAVHSAWSGRWIVEARAHLARGAFDDALAEYERAKAAGRVDELGRIRLLGALYEARDLTGADLVRGELDGTPVSEDALVREVNAETEREQQAIDAYQEGVRLLADGQDAEAWRRIDPALAYFATVKRPSLPTTRDAVLALVAGLAAEPDPEPAAR